MSEPLIHPEEITPADTVVSTADGMYVERMGEPFMKVSTEKEDYVPYREEPCGT